MLITFYTVYETNRTILNISINTREEKFDYFVYKPYTVTDINV